LVVLVVNTLADSQTLDSSSAVAMTDSLENGKLTGEKEE